MKSDFLIALTQLAAERHLPKEEVLKAIEAALASAFKKDNWGETTSVSVKLNPNTGEISAYTLKTIVDNVEDNSREISLKEAIKIKNDAVIGEMIETDSYTDKDKFIPFLRGRQEVLRDYHLDGWLVFDVPIDSKFSLLRWEISGDVIRIDL